MVSRERALYRKRAPRPLSTHWSQSWGHSPSTALSLLSPFNDGKSKRNRPSPRALKKLLKEEGRPAADRDPRWRL